MLQDRLFPSLRSFEGGQRATPLHLRLYVAAGAPNSVRAEANLRALLRQLHAEYTLEIVDCLREPLRAVADGVLASPTLLKLHPEPPRSIVGTLNDEATVAAMLGLCPDSSARREGDG